MKNSLSKGSESLNAQTIEQLSALWTTPAHQFYLAGVERVATFALQICLSYIVYRASKDKKPQFYVLAVALNLLLMQG